MMLTKWKKMSSHMPQTLRLSIEGNLGPSSSAHLITNIMQLDSLIIHSTSVEVAYDISDKFEYDVQPQPDSETQTWGWE